MRPAAFMGPPGESLIRKPIKELAEALGPRQFWQIHRGIIVNCRHIAGVSRSLTGKGVVRLKGCSKTLAVSSPPHAPVPADVKPDPLGRPAQPLATRR